MFLKLFDKHSKVILAITIIINFFCFAVDIAWWNTPRYQTLIGIYKPITFISIIVWGISLLLHLKKLRFFRSLLILNIFLSAVNVILFLLIS